LSATTERRTLRQVILDEPLQLAADQPHQVLLSTGSVAIMAQFAASSGIVAPLVGYCIALGVEWAYLRGLASDARARTWWGDALNWSAFAVVVLWGVLWVAKSFGVLAARPEGWVGWVLAVAHIVPIAWLSLCSAMCHRAAMGVDQERTRLLQAERDAIVLEAERKRHALALWEEGQAAQLRTNEAAATAKARRKASARLAVPNARTASPEGASASVLACPHCGVALPDAGAKGRAVRYGHCPSCKERRV
jgi:hypothetical protein